MMYTELTIGDKELKLRLDARACVGLERKLGKSPLAIFMDAEKSLPRLEDLILILQGSLQKYNQGYNEEKTYDLYDEYIAEGNTFTDFIPVIMSIFEVSGFFKKADVDKTKVDIEEKK
jgi:hypothetical protein